MSETRKFSSLAELLAARRGGALSGKYEPKEAEVEAKPKKKAGVEPDEEVQAD